MQTTLFKIATIVLALTLIACSPKFDWREVRGTDAPFAVLLPAKPASYAREMELNGVKLKMQMTAADADSVSFAVGYAKVDDASKIAGVLAAMKTGMLKNIQATTSKDSNQSGTEIVAYGNLQNGQPVKLVGRFFARGAWVYQVVVIGREKALTPEVVDTFMTSFKAS
ncbi:MAG: hypothetical protein Q7R66_06605 [Undibacterium sp.]|uniref:hypothetical protein n=1 Tax=Undibacterium sp. TaxID=1914977 RepID=UPI002725EE20|nr:hypothetical protein [Undibacterium sp.]MDO8651841.1 hypothetical protein [Undibacterium sp.]